MSNLELTGKTLQQLISTAPAPASRARAKVSRRTVALVLFAIVGAGLFFVRGRLFSLFASSDPTAGLYQTQRAERGLLRVTVTEDGNVESASNIDIKCQVEGGSQILSIVTEGTQVKKGTELVRLDSSAIEEQVTTQKIAYEKARSALIKAEEDFAVKTIAVKEYVEGTFVKELQTADANIVISRENLKSSQNMLEHSERMFRKGYITQLQLEQNRFAVQRAQLDLDTFLTAKKVLVEYTKAKMIRELESLRDAAQAELAAQKSSCELEKSKLERLEEQLKRCVIIAPQDGMVLYANDRSSGGRGGGNSVALIEEGALVREFQTIIRLPDLSQMQVKVLVHETKVEDLQVGMPAVVRVRDRTFTGRVSSIATQPEQANWYMSSVKEYATYVRLDDSREEGSIKPGMTAEVEILVKEIPDCIAIPLTGVIEHNRKFLSFVRTKEGYERRPVVVGVSNDKFLEIKDGLVAGDEVILNPRSAIPEARALLQEKSLSHSPLGDSAAPPKKEGAATSTESEKKTESKPLATVEKAGDAKGAANAVVAKSDDKPAKPKKGTFNLLSFDKNKDGKITLDEAPEQVKPMFSRMDANGDGAIDAKEIAEIRKFMQQRQAAGQGGAPPATGPGGAGRPPGVGGAR